MNLYARTTHDGKAVDELTHLALVECERRLGYELTIVQGSYNGGGVSASAGTHDGGGAVDLAPHDWQRKVRVLRAVGFAAWHRPAIPGLWGEHIHAVLIGNAKLSPSAQRQVDAYRNGRNGLANNGPDDFGWRPNPIPTFKPHDPTRGKNIEHAIDDLQAAAKANADKPVRFRRIKAALSHLAAVKPR